MLKGFSKSKEAAAEGASQADPGGKAPTAGVPKNESSAPKTSAPLPRKSSNLKSKLLIGAGSIFLGLVLLFFVIRWLGTSTLTGTIQKVYDNAPEYRIEFAELDGDTHVLGNQNLAFPYFKTDADDLHAELNRMALEGNVIALRVWGYRGTWLGFFPNVIAFELIESGEERLRRRAERIADAVIASLKNRGALRPEVDARPLVIEAVERAEAQPLSSPEPSDE